MLPRLAFYAHGTFAQLRRRARAALGWTAPLRILPYRGYGTRQHALIKARVLEGRAPPPAPERPHTVWSAALASWRRYATREVPEARVRVRWNDVEWEGATDEEGFLDLKIIPPPDAAPGWHAVSLTLLEADAGDAEPVLAPVLLVGEDAEYGVISDIDDTVIVTGVVHPLKRAHALFLADHRVRLPFEGVDAFYAALHAGRSGRAGNPVFYVSSSPWNLFEHLDGFFALHRIPPGPLLLRDWGLSRHGFAPGGGHGHKLDKVRGLLEAFPHLRFVLVGDSGQQDPEHYRTIVREAPERILAVYIRTVPHRRGRELQLERLAEEVRALGVDYVAVDSTADAARHAAERGWVAPPAVTQVALAEVADRESTPLLGTPERPA